MNKMACVACMPVPRLLYVSVQSGTRTVARKKEYIYIRVEEEETRRKKEMGIEERDGDRSPTGCH